MITAVLLYNTGVIRIKQAGGISPKRWFVYALMLSNILSVWLLVLRFLSTDSFEYWYFVWNLFLAWVPVGFAVWLTRRLKTEKWATLRNGILTLAWLLFLPNSFYLVTDLIHLKQTYEIDYLFDIVMFGHFIMNAYIAGFIAVYMVHRHIERVLGTLRGLLVVLVVFVLSGYAIYLGRVLRWNSWDVLINPAALLFDVSEGVVNPVTAAHIVFITSLFTLLVGSLYAIVWTAIRFLVPDEKKQRQKRAKKQR